ncbi:TPA: hypothetical protein ACGSVU_004057, partial [Shigella flexneri]
VQVAKFSVPLQSSSVAIADRVAPGVDDNPRERQIIERRASHSLPSMSPEPPRESWRLNFLRKR